jgi:hypothetical protein
MFIQFIVLAIMFVLAFSFLIFLAVSYKDRHATAVYWSLVSIDGVVLLTLLKLLAVLSARM